MRLGVSLAVTRYEEAAILGDDSELAEKTLRKLLAEGRFTPDGNSYIPGGVVLAFNNEHGTGHSARDISLVVLEKRCASVSVAMPGLFHVRWV